MSNSDSKSLYEHFNQDVPVYEDELPLIRSLMTIGEIDTLENVNENFKAYVRATAFRVMSYQRRYCCFYMLNQSAKFAIIYDKPKVQRWDDVTLYFITGFCGSAVTVRLVGNTITFIRSAVDKFNFIEFNHIDELLSVIDREIDQLWYGT